MRLVVIFLGPVLELAALVPPSGRGVVPSISGTAPHAKGMMIEIAASRE